jgi:hypothetical protein
VLRYFRCIPGEPAYTQISIKLCKIKEATGSLLHYKDQQGAGRHRGASISRRLKGYIVCVDRHCISLHTPLLNTKADGVTLTFPEVILLLAYLCACFNSKLHTLFFYMQHIHFSSIQKSNRVSWLNSSDVTM